MIPTDQCIIQKYKLTKGDSPNKNHVYVKYTNTRQRIAIPNGCSLYHNSITNNIKELIPSFQGKSSKGYFYSSPRVYLTIRKDMPILCADIKVREKNFLYKVKENIRFAYVDPLITSYKYGAVYVDTKFPIPVENVKSDNNVKESVNDQEFLEGEPVFTSLEEFVEYYGLEIIEDTDVIEESFASKIGNVQRSLADKSQFKSFWTKSASTIQHKTIEKIISINEYEKLNANYNILKESNAFMEYKKSYEYICKFFGLPTKETTIKRIKFTDAEKGKKKVKIIYHIGKIKFIIPNDVQLIHTSSNGNIKELIPNFCSKKRGMYMWASKRVYFTLGKAIDQKKVGMKNKEKSYKYTPKDIIRTAYIDSELPSFNMKCVYVDTMFPIPVKRLDEPEGIIGSLKK